MRPRSNPLQILVLERGRRFVGLLRAALPFSDTPARLHHEFDGFAGLAVAARALPDIVFVARELWELPPGEWKAAFHNLFPEAKSRIVFFSTGGTVTELVSPKMSRPVHMSNNHAGALDVLDWAAEQVEFKGSPSLLSVHQLWRFRDYRVSQEERQTILNLSKLAALRDRPSANHPQRMTAYVRCIARQLGLPSAATEALAMASALHDIGHLSVPEDVLFKTDALNDEEVDMMRDHPRAGHHILSAHESLIFSLAAELTFAHHERWDGGGYPLGLSGEDIPLSARIVATADAFDLIVSSRHDTSSSVGRALAHLQQQAGLAFDPWLVAEINKIVHELHKIMESLPFESELGHDQLANGMPSLPALMRRGLAADLDEFEDCQALIALGRRASSASFEVGCFL
jgi:HD-GYP domain-containing protein (c-di-GMP phosphodiesterase class II)